MEGGWRREEGGEGTACRISRKEQEWRGKEDGRTDMVK